VLRGLHFQVEQPQRELVQVIAGEILDAAVDLRKGSTTFGKWLGVRLSSANHQMIWLPKGFAHGFLTLSESADVLYKVTDFYAPQHERPLLWNDPDVAVEWPLQGEPILSDEDRAGMRLVPKTSWSTCLDAQSGNAERFAGRRIASCSFCAARFVGLVQE